MTPKRGVKLPKTNSESEIDLTRKLPQHIAIIMDGNGRWARDRGLAAIRGHTAGVDAVRAAVEESVRLGIKQLTLYAFSTENWKRSKAEVSALMRLYKKFLVEEREEIVKNNIRFAAIGVEDRLPKAVLREMAKTTEVSRNNDGLTLCLAINYGGHREITDAARELAAKAARGDINPDDITEDTFTNHLYTAGMPDVDLMIRTAGESRISNFLLWQSWYAEICVLPVCWPDFGKQHFAEAIAEYQRRKRTYGSRT